MLKLAYSKWESETFLGHGVFVYWLCSNVPLSWLALSPVFFTNSFPLAQFHLTVPSPPYGGWQLLLLLYQRNPTPLWLQANICHSYNVQTGKDFCPTTVEASLANEIAQVSVCFSSSWQYLLCHGRFNSSFHFYVGSNSYIRCLFIDFSQAFDVVRHSIWP